MEPQEKPQFLLNEDPQTYNVRITNKTTGEVVQDYDTEIAILFGVVKREDQPEQAPVKSIYLGDGFQLAQLLNIINENVIGYLGSLFKKDQALMRKGKPSD